MCSAQDGSSEMCTLRDLSLFTFSTDQCRQRQWELVKVFLHSTFQGEYSAHLGLINCKWENVLFVLSLTMKIISSSSLWQLHIHCGTKLRERKENDWLGNCWCSLSWLNLHWITDTYSKRVERNIIPWHKTFQFLFNMKVPCFFSSFNFTNIDQWKVKLIFVAISSLNCGTGTFDLLTLHHSFSWEIHMLLSWVLEFTVSECRH